MVAVTHARAENRGLLRRTAFIFAILWFATWAQLSHSGGVQRPVPTVEDAINMVRIQRTATADGRVGAFSPDGRRFAFVTWQGDLSRNANIYKLMLMELPKRSSSQATINTVLMKEYIGDPDDQDASPFEKITFVDNRTIAYLGRIANGSQQVFSVDTEARKPVQLTRHPTVIREFIADARGNVRLFSAAALSENDIARSARLQEDGVFLWDEALFEPAPTFKAKAILDFRERWIRQYFVSGPDGSRLVYDTRQSRPANLVRSPEEQDRGFSVQLHEDETLQRRATLTGDPQKRFALMYPYAPAEQRPHDSAHDETGATEQSLSQWNSKLAAPYGWVDLATGRVERFVEAPHLLTGSAGGGGSPRWAPDGHSVVIFVQLPDKGDTTSQRPQWVEVDIATRSHKALNVPVGWRVMGWDVAGSGLILEKDDQFAHLRRSPNGGWEALQRIAAIEQLNWRWEPATNGQVVIGVSEGSYAAPELVAFDLASRKITTLTDLNPELRQRRYGKVEEFAWSHRYDENASGFVIKPPDVVKDKRYPLVVLLDDGMLKRMPHPYLLDGFVQLSGHAVQMLAAQGFVVLYTREPRSFMGDGECERMREHVESAVAKLDRAGLIDPNRVGLSGFSRAAYHTDCILMNAHGRFAAATRIDGGGREFKPKFRPYTDLELQRVRAPLLIETHGLRNLVMHTTMADRLEAFGRPTEVLYFHSASHSTTRPQHRLRSLETHMDWWRFWLKGEEDPDSAKAGQYTRWRKLRADWERVAAVKGPEAVKSDSARQAAR